VNKNSRELYIFSHFYEWHKDSLQYLSEDQNLDIINADTQCERGRDNPERGPFCQLSFPYTNLI
jgi:hypothetical protein